APLPQSVCHQSAHGSAVSQGVVARIASPNDSIVVEVCLINLYPSDLSIPDGAVRRHGPRQSPHPGRAGVPTNRKVGLAASVETRARRARATPRWRTAA